MPSCDWCGHDATKKSVGKSTPHRPLLHIVVMTNYACEPCSRKWSPMVGFTPWQSIRPQHGAKILPFPGKARA